MVSPLITLLKNNNMTRVITVTGCRSLKLFDYSITYTCSPCHSHTRGTDAPWKNYPTKTSHFILYQCRLNKLQQQTYHCMQHTKIHYQPVTSLSWPFDVKVATLDSSHSLSVDHSLIWLEQVLRFTRSLVVCWSLWSALLISQYVNRMTTWRAVCWCCCCCCFCCCLSLLKCSWFL